MTPPPRVSLPWRKLWIVSLIFMSLTWAHASVPTSNPVADRYGPEAYPWAAEISWANVHNILDYGGVADGSTPNDSAFTSAREAAVLSGGGVVFFPAGDYFFAQNLLLADQVVVRGEAADTPNAQDTSFRPPSRLIFPRFVFDPTANEGNGTDPATAFKGITMAGGQAGRNVGVVDMDIQRAGLFAGGSGLSSRNVVVMGIRSNNVATRQTWTVPTPQQHPWQIHPNRFAFNISAFAFENVLVANNRLNDMHYWVHRAVDGESLDGAPADFAQMEIDDFVQPGYIIRHESQNTWIPIEERFPGREYIFNYTDHYGIRSTGSTGEWGAAPWEQPNLFFGGTRDIRDNWVYTTMRTKIAASGRGLVIRDNILRDRRSKLRLVSPNGDQVVQNAATLENRGIDWRGSDILIENNDIEVHRHRLRTPTGYPSVDGEGILHQEVHGTTIENVVIRANQSTAYIGLWKMPYIRNVLIEDNVLSTNNINNKAYVYVHSNTNNRNFPMYGVTVRNNIAPGGVNVRAGYHSPDQLSAEIYGNRVDNTISVENHMTVGANFRLDGITPATVNTFSASVPLPPPARGVLFADAPPSAAAPGDPIRLTVRVTEPGAPVTQVEFYNHRTLLGIVTEPPFEWVWSATGSPPQFSAAIRQAPVPTGFHPYAALLLREAPEEPAFTPEIFVVSPTGELVEPVDITFGIHLHGETHDWQRMEIYRNGELLETLLAGDPLSFTWLAASQGSHRLIVRAWDTAGRVTLSETLIVDIEGAPDAAPAHLTVQPLSDTALHVEWTDQASNATSFLVQYRADASDPWENVPTIETHALLTDLLPGTSYSLRVVPVNAYGAGPASETVTAATFATATAVPAPPAEFSAQMLMSGQVNLMWEAGDAQAYRFEIEMSESPGAPWVPLAQISALETGATPEVDLAPGERRLVRLRAGNHLGDSDWSEIHVITRLTETFPLTFSSLGEPWTLPGRVEVEDYNPGGFFDTTATNQGNSTYRAPDPVDIATSGSGRTIGWTANGEWLEYTVNVSTAGLYQIRIGYATPNSTGQLGIHLDGHPLLPPATLANTGGWNTYQEHATAPVYLEAGVHLLRLVIVTQGFNLDYIDFELSEAADFEVWRASRLDAGSGTGPREDASGNGLANRLHWLMGLDPLSQDRTELEIVKDGDALSLRFPLAKGLENPVWTLQSTNSPAVEATWAPPAQMQLLPLREEPRRLWWEARLPLEEGARFWRLQAE